MGSRQRLIAAAAALVVATGFAVGGCGDEESSATGSGVALQPIGASGVTGSVGLVQSGTTVSGTIRIDGLQPGSSHDAHIHGVAGEDHACAADQRTSEHLVDLPNIVADDKGVAQAEINVTAPEDTIRTGTYLMVHALPGAHPGGGEGVDHEQSNDSAATAILAAYVPVHGGAPTAPYNPAIACADFENQ